MFGNIGTPEIILIIVAILILFGAKKIPELARGLGKGMKEFKKAVKEVEDDIKMSDDEEKEKDKSEKNLHRKIERDSCIKIIRKKFRKLSPVF